MTTPFSTRTRIRRSRNGSRVCWPADSAPERDPFSSTDLPADASAVIDSFPKDEADSSPKDEAPIRSSPRALSLLLARRYGL